MSNRSPSPRNEDEEDKEEDKEEEWIPRSFMPPYIIVRATDFPEQKIQLPLYDPSSSVSLSISSTEPKNRPKLSSCTPPFDFVTYTDLTDQSDIVYIWNSHDGLWMCFERDSLIASLTTQTPMAVWHGMRDENGFGGKADLNDLVFMLPDSARTWIDAYSAQDLVYRCQLGHSYFRMEFDEVVRIGNVFSSVLRVGSLHGQAPGVKLFSIYSD